jgi:predicted nucleic acid-binding protein
VTRFVVDASVAVKWFVPEDDDEAALALLDPAHELHAPDLLAAEFGNTIWKKLMRGELIEEEARTVIHALSVVPLSAHACQALLPAAFDIAVRTKRTVYDSLYISLATGLGARLVTADEKFVNALSSTPFADDVIHVRSL